MASRSSVRVCYGIDFGPVDEGGDAGKFNYDDEPDNSGTPAGLAYYGATKESPVEVIDYGHHSYRRVVLAANHLTTCGRAFLPVDLSEMTIEPNIGAADHALWAYCEEHGLTYSQPRWLAVPYYG